jgi:hypothetical protein
MRKLMRKRILVPVVAAMALAVAGIAVAYFTASGTGSGTATVGTAGGVTITDVSFGGDLYPGGATSVSFRVNNTSSDTAVRVGKVVVSSIRTPLGCDASDFGFADVDVNAEIPANGSTSGSGSLTLANSSSNQDACQGASVDLNLSVDNSGL